MDLQGLWQHMGLLAKGIFFLLFVMSIWSFYVFFDRLLVFRAARKQSRSFAFAVTRHLSEDNLQAAIDESSKYKSSHLAKVVKAGLLEFQHDVESGAAEVTGHDVIAAANRAIERATLMTTEDLRKGLSVLATIGSTAVFVGLFGTVVGVINAFTGIAEAGGGGLGAVSAGIAEALIETAVGLVVAIPAVWMFNFFTNRIERFQIEMSNSANELIDFLIKKQARAAARA